MLKFSPRKPQFAVKSTFTNVLIYLLPYKRTFVYLVQKLNFIPRKFFVELILSY